MKVKDGVQNEVRHELKNLIDFINPGQTGDLKYTPQIKSDPTGSITSLGP